MDKRQSAWSDGIAPHPNRVTNTLAASHQPLVQLVQAGAALCRKGFGKTATCYAGRVPNRPALVEETHQEGFQQPIYMTSQVLRGDLMYYAQNKRSGLYVGQPEHKRASQHSHVYIRHCCNVHMYADVGRCNGRKCCFWSDRPNPWQLLSRCLQTLRHGQPVTATPCRQAISLFPDYVSIPRSSCHRYKFVASIQAR